VITVVVVGALVVWPTQGRQSLTTTTGGRQAPASTVGAGTEAASAAASARPGTLASPERTRDADGARAAALELVELNERIVELDDQAALDARREVSTSGAADALVEQLRTELTRLRKDFPTGSITYRVAPLAVRVNADGHDAFKADVWYVGVVAARELPTYEEWTTESYRLVWERDAWRLASVASTPGPRPDPSRQPQASSTELAARLAGFDTVR
jgi:hypothetical protein